MNNLKRPLVFTTVFFILGIYGVQSELNLIITLVPFFVLSIYALFYKPKLLSFILAAMTVFFLGQGRMLFAMHQRDELIKKYDGKTYNTKLTAVDFSSNNSFPAEMKLSGKKINVYLYIEECPNVEPGDIVSAQIQLSAPQKDRNSQTDFNSYLSGRNIFISGYGEKCSVVSQDKSFFKGTIYKIRKSLSKASQNAFRGDIMALYNAMVYGDNRFLSGELKDILQKSGQNHIAVVSGMHLSVMSMVVMTLLGLVFGKRRIGNVISIFAVVFMTFVTGAGASVVRACVMSVIYHSARLLFRESDSLTSLCASALLMLVFNPFVINNVGFVLSVLSVLGIILYCDKFTLLFSKVMPKSPAGATAVCMAAQMTVVPAVMYYFGVITPYAPVANLLISSLSTIMVIAGMLFGVLSSVPVVSMVLEGVLEAVSYTIIWVCSFIAKLPFATVSTGGLSPGVFLCSVVLLVAVKLYPKHKKLLLKLSAAVLCVCVTVVTWRSDKIHIRYLDYITDGTSFIELNDGKSLFIGCSDSSDVIALSERYSSGEIECIMQTYNDAREILKAAQTGNVRKVVLNKRIVSKSVLEKMKKTEAEIILLEENQEYEVNGLLLSYDDAGKETKNAIARIDAKSESAVFLHSLTNEDIKEIYKSGKTVYSTYYCPGKAFSQREDMLVGINRGREKQNFFLKDK